MRTHRWLGLFPFLVLLACMSGCGDGADDDSDPQEAGSTSQAQAGSESGSPSADPGAPDATTEILGVPGLFRAGGDGAVPLDAEVNGRECVLTDALFGSCRASTGAGGTFLVTAESTAEAPTTWKIVVRCGTSPGVPAASAQGDFQPQTSDVGLEPYGEVLGVTLVGDVAEAALVYQPQGAACPVVWGLGDVDRGSFFTGGLDALSGASNALRFTNAQGVSTCAVADGAGGIAVSPCPD